MNDAVNKLSIDWVILKKRSIERIVELRDELEIVSLSPDRTMEIRGRIAALREQIDFVEPGVKPIVKDVNYHG